MFISPTLGHLDGIPDRYHYKYLCNVNFEGSLSSNLSRVIRLRYSCFFRRSFSFHGSRNAKVMSAFDCCGFFVQNFPRSISAICVVLVTTDIIKLVSVAIMDNSKKLLLTAVFNFSSRKQFYTLLRHFSLRIIR